MSELSPVPVRAAMTEVPLRLIDGLATVADALELMRAHAIGCLVVDRRHPGDEYGLLLIGDVAREVIARNRAPSRVSVYEVMTKPAVALDGEMAIPYALRLMTRLGLSHGLVMHGRELLGIVTLRDLVLGQHEAEGRG